MAISSTRPSKAYLPKQEPLKASATKLNKLIDQAFITATLLLV